MIALSVMAIVASACADNDQDMNADEYVAAVRERSVALCVCLKGDAGQCVAGEADECGYEILGRRAHEFGDSLECLTRWTMEQIPCFQSCDMTIMSVNDANSCLQMIEPACEPSASVRNAIQAEIDDRCLPLVRCPDGSPADAGICPAFLPEAGPGPSCASEVLATAGDVVTSACAECACEAAPDATLNCDASCWGLIACGHAHCAGLGAGDPFNQCIVANCDSFLESVSATASLHEMLTGPCATECSVLGL